MYEVNVKSVVIDWPERILEITDTDGIKLIVPPKKTITVTMVGHPRREEKRMTADQLGRYMNRGYIIEHIRVGGDISEH